jgi:hypothetical protein
MSTFLHNRTRLYTVVQKVYRLSDRGFLQPVSMRCAVAECGSEFGSVWQCGSACVAVQLCAAVLMAVCGSVLGSVRQCVATVRAAVCGSAHGVRAVCIPTTCMRAGLIVICSVSCQNTTVQHMTGR